MRTFTNVAAQGDIFLRKIAALPEAAEPAKPVSGKYICAHSETGHEHVVAEGPGIGLYADPKDDMKSYLVVKNIMGALLEHLRPFDTHEAISIPPGVYEIRRQREYIPQGWRKVED